MRSLLIGLAILVTTSILLPAQTQTSIPVAFSDEVRFDGVRVNLAECHLIDEPGAAKCNVHVENVGKQGIKALGVQIVFYSQGEKRGRQFVGVDYAFPHPKSKGSLKPGKEGPVRARLIYGEKVPTFADITLKFIELEDGDVVPLSAKDTDDYKEIIENRKNARK